MKHIRFFNVLLEFLHMRNLKYQVLYCVWKVSKMSRIYLICLL
jgi:hypothetical protein